MNTILVTGGCGYLGSQLIRDLATDPQTRDTTIRVLDNLEGGGYRALMDLPASGRYQFVEGDILDPAIVRVALQDVDAVVHLAAIVRTPMSFENPAHMEQVNHWGTAHLVEACIETGVSQFVYASSTAVYGPGGPFTEADVCRPQGAYARSKFHAEKSVLSAADRGMKTVVLRLGTLFGWAPVTRFDAVANRFAYLAGTRKSLTVYGDGKQRRPLVHVRDASTAIQLALMRLETMNGQVANVIGENAAILDIVEAVRASAPNAVVRFTEQDIRTHLSFEIADSVFYRAGWQPQVSLQEGLAELLDRFQMFEPIVLPRYDDE
jgi:nucleoside-diphosphate-sugar epimerase